MNSGSKISLGSGTKLVIISGTLSIPSGVTLAVGSRSTLTINSGNIINHDTITNSGTINSYCNGTILGPVSGNAVINYLCHTAVSVSPNPAYVHIGSKITFKPKLLIHLPAHQLRL